MEVCPGVCIGPRCLLYANVSLVRLTIQRQGEIVISTYFQIEGLSINPLGNNNYFIVQSGGTLDLSGLEPFNW